MTTNPVYAVVKNNQLSLVTTAHHYSMLAHTMASGATHVLVRRVPAGETKLVYFGCVVDLVRLISYSPSSLLLFIFF